MGMDRTIRLPGSAVPPWDDIRTHLRRVGEEPVVRMIDGLPAFPDETPEPGWKEIRVGLAAGMVSLRRGPGGLVCVVWGNADAGLVAGWDKLCWACAAAGGGVVVTPTGDVSADDFAAAHHLPLS